MPVNDPGVVQNDSVPGGLQSAVLDSNPTLGTITSWDGLGGFTYVPNYHAYGTDSFTYHDVDMYGQSSNTATVTIDVIETAPVAAPDGTYWTLWNKSTLTHNTITVDASQGVLANDTDQDPPDFGNLKAVLDASPADGSLTLNPDGSFVYTPNVGFGGYDQFTYHATDGILNSATVAVTLAVQKVDLDLWDGGPNGTQVPDSKENTRGAFAVSNQNDTNGDGTSDYAQNPVIATPKGRNEIDLMKLVINKPVPANSGNLMQLSLSQGLSLWTDPVKTAPYATPDNQAVININSLPMTVYVEAGRVSSSFRDMGVTLEYNNMSDSIAVTSIWATVTAVETATKGGAAIAAEFPDMDPDLVTGISNYGGTGQQGPFENGANNNGAGKGAGMGTVIQYTIEPAYGQNDPTWESQGVNFDSTRQTNRYAWKQVNPGDPYALDSSEDWPAQVELPNDDTSWFDESNAVTSSSHFYAYDRAGVGTYLADYNDLISQFNFKEFLRVAIDAPRPLGEVVAGSRCSDYQPWHVREDFDKGPNGVWAWDKTGTNDVGTGNVTLQNTAP